jgi:hypothetical protein
MGRLWLRRPSPSLVISLIALVAALGSGAYAAMSGIPDAKGVFHGCVNTRTGALRVVKSAGSCRRSQVLHHGGKRIVIPGEFAIAWNQSGPAGAPGVQGPQGVQGSQGPQGANGTNGTNGTNGRNGTNGAAHVVVRSAANPSPSNYALVSCAPGEVATGGGGQAFGSDSVMSSFPQPATSGAQPTGWEILDITGASAGQLIAWVICASP